MYICCVYQLNIFSITISNAEIERTFSSFSYLKNKLRNNLNNEHLNE